MQGARARVHLHACQKKVNRLSADDPVYICAWFAVRFLAVQRTEILLLHACCSKKLVCTCISVPFQRNFSQLVTRFFSTAANFIQLYGYSLGYWTSNHSGNH